MRFDVVMLAGCKIDRRIAHALAVYLANREKVDEYLAKGEHEFEQLREEWRRESPL